MKAAPYKGLTDEQFLARIEADPNGGCWLWGGAISGGGYGTIRVAGVEKTTHRDSYRRFVGPIPEGALICHKCDVRACVNPQHLYAGNRKTNGEDMARRGRAHRQTPLTEADEAAIVESSEAVEELAARFSVCNNTIRRLRRLKGVGRGASNRGRTFLFYRGIAPTVSGRFIAFHRGLSLGTYDDLLEAIWVKAAKVAERRGLPKHDETLWVLRSGLAVMESLDGPLDKRQTRELMAEQERIGRILQKRGWK